MAPNIPPNAKHADGATNRCSWTCAPPLVQLWGRVLGTVSISFGRNLAFGSIANAYAEEQSKAIRSSVTNVEHLMRRVRAKHELLDRKLFSKLRKTAMPGISALMHVIDKLQQWLYDAVQIGLDNLRLRLRGINLKRP